MKKSIDDVMEEFKDFTDGVRTLFLIHRSKEGGGNKGTKMYKEITTNSEEFKDKLEYLYTRALMEEEWCLTPQPLRIYSSVNSRDMNKAIRMYKTKQLDSDYDSEIVRNRFYNDAKNRWMSSLMSPRARESKFFLIDVDDMDFYQDVKDFLGENEINIQKGYFTPNGYHFITQPFNPNLLEQKNVKDVSINKDGLLLLTCNKHVV